MKKIGFYFIIIIIHLSCVSKKLDVSFTRSNVSLDFINDSIFEFKYYHNDYDTVFLQYSYGTYSSIKKNLYLVNSKKFNNLSYPIHVIENYDKTASDSLRISLKTSITRDLIPEINTILEIDSLTFKIGKASFDTVIGNRKHIKIIKVSVRAPKNSGLPKLNYTLIQSNTYYVKSNQLNKLTIDFPIYDYLFNYVSLQNQLIEKSGKFLILKSENGDRKLLNGGKIYHCWEYNPWTPIN
jgi:hypothetical protein